MAIQTPEDCVNFRPMSKAAMRRLFAPARHYFDPQFRGLEALDLSRPALFVGNHTIYGLTDAPLLIEHLYTQHDVVIRSLGDRVHFKLPGWSQLLVRQGMVLGSPAHCSALMQAGQSIMVFPGGAREVMRRRGEKHRLIWKQRSGFARLAVEHGYDIIPFASVGPDDAFSILLDGNQLRASKPWQWLDRNGRLSAQTRGGDMLPPVVRGLGPSLMPRPQRYYFGFGPRISTTAVAGRQDDADIVWQIREQTAHSIEEQIQHLLEYRKTDSKSWSRLRRRLAPLQAS